MCRNQIVMKSIAIFLALFVSVIGFVGAQTGGGAGAGNPGAGSQAGAGFGVGFGSGLGLNFRYHQFAVVWMNITEIKWLNF